MFSEFDEYDRIFDPWIAGSELYNLNHSNGKWVKVSPNLLYVIKASMNFARLTDGTFDPTIGRLIPLWGFNTDNTKSWHLPTSDEIQESLKHVGYKNVEINGNEVRLLNGVWLDLNGMMEGYIDQMLIDMAKQNDPESSGFVDVGGTVGIIGPKYGNQPWIIGIQNFESVTTVSTRSIFSDGFGVFSMVAGQSAMEKMASKLGVAYYAINEQGQVIKNEEWQKYEYKP